MSTPCEYNSVCTNKGTYLVITKIGEYFMCAKHAKLSEKQKEVRYIFTAHGRKDVHHAQS
jgi:hypothetical protein